jgi:hypothetical protein
MREKYDFSQDSLRQIGENEKKTMDGIALGRDVLSSDCPMYWIFIFNFIFWLSLCSV